MLAVSTFSGEAPGPHILILGGVHGDERCGVIALSHLKFELEQKIIPVKAGKVTLVPLCNPAAYRQGKRYLKYNLNRIISHYDSPSCDEEVYANELARLIELADIVLDLHSYSSGRLPYLFLDKPTADNIELAKAQGIENWITGWDKIYGQPELNSDPTDTVQYAYRQGKTAMFVECGQHDNPAAVNVAYTCARRTLAHFGAADHAETETPKLSKITCVERIIRRDKEGRFVKDWTNFDVFKKGDALIEYDDKSFATAPYDGIIILPDAKAAWGQEWVYLGQETDKY